MKSAIYPGTFDPMTYGHLDIIKRAANIFDEVIVGVLDNKEKTPLFSVDVRVNILKKATENIPNVKVESFGGLLVPIKDWGTTFYTRFGDIFARLNALITLSALVWLSHRWLQLKKALLKAVEPNTKALPNVTKKSSKKS